MFEHRSREPWYDERNEPAVVDLAYVVAFESYRSRMVGLSRPLPPVAHEDGLVPVPDALVVEVDDDPDEVSTVSSTPAPALTCTRQRPPVGRFPLRFHR